VNKLLSVSGISKCFKDMQNADVYLWEDVSFDLSEGESVSICGESGSGKSTLLFALGGMEKIQSGSIEFCGKELGYKQKHFVPGIEHVYQHYQLIEELDVLENIVLPCQIKGQKVDSKLLDFIIESLKLKPFLHRSPTHLSGGERQRVAIARALVTKPKLLLADEPTGSLDEISGKNVMDLFFYVCKSLGTSFILVTHNVSFAQRTDKLFYLKQGSLVDAKS